MALSDIAVLALKARQKPYKVFDCEDLFLLVNRNGSKLCRGRYRFDQKEARMALGEYHVVSLAEARERHFSTHKVLATGVDPMTRT